MNDITNQPATDRAFLNVLSAHRNGNLITEVSKALKQVTAACQDTGKEGKVTLVMTLRPATLGDAATLIFEPTVKANIPENKPPGSIFYANDDFDLVREDPRQQRLDLKVVEQPQPVEIKTINP